MLAGFNHARGEEIKRGMPVTFKIENPASWRYEVRTIADSEVLKMRRGNEKNVNLFTLEVRFGQSGRTDDAATSCSGGCSVTMTHKAAYDRIIDISHLDRVDRE